MGLVHHHRPSLLRTARDVYLREEEDDARQAEERGKPPDPRGKQPRGLAVYLDPDRTWKVDQRSPWARIPAQSAKIGALARVAFLGGTMVEAGILAHGITQELRKMKKTRTTMLRRLFTHDDLDLQELASGAEVFDGVLVPPHPDNDAAISFERTRRRVLRLVESAIMQGWTAAPLIAMETRTPEFTERIPQGLADFLIITDPTPASSLANVPTIVVPAKQGPKPWWAGCGNFLYALDDNHLWWQDWMENPLTLLE